MTRGFGTLAARPRKGVALLAATLAAGALLAAPAGSAKASLDVVLPVSGVCLVSGTASFSPLPKLPQSTGIAISVQGGCNGVGVGGAGVSILMSTPDLVTGSCVALEGAVSGTVSFTNSSIPPYSGQGTLIGDLVNIDVEIANTAQQFFGSLQLVDTTLLAADTCAGGNLGSITVTGTFTFATL